MIYFILSLSCKKVAIIITFYKLKIMNRQLSTGNYQLLILVVALLFFSMPVKAQVTVGDITPPQSFSVLELTTAKLKGGLRLPQLSTQQRKSLDLTVNPTLAQGLLIYNTDIGCVEFWNLNEWITICNGRSNIYLTDAGNVPVDPSATPFPQAGLTTDILVPHDTPECATPPNPPYTASIKYGAAYASVAAAAPAGTGAFTMKVEANTGCGSRYIILAVMDNCLNQEQYFLFVQEGINALPVTPTGSITGPTSVCPTGITQIYSITPVAGAKSYLWKLPEGWTGTSNTETITATPGLPTGTKLAENTAANGNITVSAVNECGVTSALTLQVTTCSGCCAYVSNTDYVEFMCHDLGANQDADPLTPSQDLHGAKYKWGTGLVALSAVDDQNPDSIFISGTWRSSAYGGAPSTNIADWDMTTANPCPSGYRVPTSTEWVNVMTNNTPSQIGDLNDNKSYTIGICFGNSLFLPFAWLRSTNGSLDQRTSAGLYWSSSPADNNNGSYALAYYYSWVGGMFGGYNYDKYTGASVRCIKQ